MKTSAPVKPFDARELQRMTAAAIQAGTHAPIERWRTVCDGCREWVNGIYHVTFDGKRFCATCADEKSGAGPKAFAEKQAARAGGAR